MYPRDRPEQGILPEKDRLIKLFQVSQIFALCHPAPMAKSLVIADLPTLKEKKNVHGLNTGLIRAKRQSSDSQKDINIITASFSFLIFHAALESGLYTYICTPFQTHTWQSTKLPPRGRQHCYIASQWLARRGQIFARCWKIPAQWLGPSNKPEKARGSPPLFLSRWAIHMYPNIHSPEEQNSPFQFPWPPARKGDRTQVSHPKSSQRAAQRSPPSCPRPQPCAQPSGRDTSHWATTGMLPRELARKNKTPPWATAANLAGVLLNPVVQQNNWSSLETSTSEEISAATTPPWVTDGLM